MRGVSPVISFVLVVFIVIVSTIAAYLWASDVVKTMNEPGRVKNYVNQFVALDQALKQTARGDYNFTNQFELYHPDSDAFVQVRDDVSAITFIFNQYAQIIGYTPEKQVRIAWTTDESSNSSVNYGATRNLGTIAGNSSLVTLHNITITAELHPNVMYYYNTTSCDAVANCNTSGTYNFTIT